MKRLKQYAAFLLLAALPCMVACSDDEGPAMPSDEIVQVDFYKSGGDSFTIQARYKFTYDAKSRVTGVRTDYLRQEVSFTYGASTIAYRWEGMNADSTLFINRFEADLKNGRVNVMRSDRGNYTYFYNAQGYLSDVSFAANKSLSYKWNKNALLIESDPTTYETEYNYSTVLNDYSIDLNVLPQLIDAREEFALVLNSYGQLAEVLGQRYPYFLEDTDYSYRYHYDENDRLVQIEMTPAGLVPGKQETYWVMLTYAD